MTSTTRKSRPAAPSPAEVGVEIGDFFVSSWGYDQTNVDFYKVVGLTPKGVKVQKWTSAVVDDNGPTTHVVPGGAPRTYTDYSDAPEGADYWDRQAAAKEVEAPIQTKRLSAYGEGEYRRVYFTVNSYSSASKWDGKPEYATGFGFGH